MFEARFSLPERRFPVRAYLLETGSRVYGNGDKYENAKGYLVGTLDDHEPTFAEHTYGIAILRSKVKDRSKVLDVFAYAVGEVWKGEPKVQRFVFRNGILVPADEIVVCSSTTVLLASERTFRKTTRDLADYMQRNPTDLGGLESGIEHDVVVH